MVAKGLKPKGQKDWLDIFAAILQLEAKNMLFRVAALGGREWMAGSFPRQRLMFVDTQKAHLDGKVAEGEMALKEFPAGSCEKNMW